jgi:hypothetical protein
MTKTITEMTTIDSKDAANLPEQLLTYGEAIKLVAGVLRANPDAGSVVVECLRDIVEGTGLNVTYEPQEAA